MKFDLTYVYVASVNKTRNRQGITNFSSILRTQKYPEYMTIINITHYALCTLDDPRAEFLAKSAQIQSKHLSSSCTYQRPLVIQDSKLPHLIVLLRNDPSSRRSRM